MYGSLDLAIAALHACFTVEVNFGKDSRHIPAGLARMPLGAFVGYTALGAGAWNAILALIGVLLSRVPGIETKEQVVAKASEYSHIIGYSILAIVLLLLTIYIVRHVKRKRHRNLVTD